MAVEPFNRPMQAYDEWKTGMIDALRRLETWLRTHIPEDGGRLQRLSEAVRALEQDRLTLAVVAEFSRGKSELINAIFFADCGRRLLPSQAGRTTMCPTELFFDRVTRQAYIQLLPIETRADARPVSTCLSEPERWNVLPLETDSPEQMAEAFRELTRTKRVPLEEAHRLGLGGDGEEADADGTVAIPCWRHARVSFPHPLLSRGLVLLDTPGLNALGAEPELTLNMLPAAQGVLFVLGADTGVTRSDRDMWSGHLQGLWRANPDAVAVALNKIDTLWDELNDWADVERDIDAQRRSSAEALGVAPAQVFPVSAQKALLAKVRDDATLLNKSRLADLERYIGERILPRRLALLQEHIQASVGEVTGELEVLGNTRLEAIGAQLTELESLRGRNEGALTRLLACSREEQSRQEHARERFEASRRIFEGQAARVRESLDLEAFDALIRDCRREMAGSWTTRGLRAAMDRFVEGATLSMEQVFEQTEQARSLAEACYRRFHEELGLPRLRPREPRIGQYRRELQWLCEEAEGFRSSALTAITEQSMLIEKFFATLVTHARELFAAGARDVADWLDCALAPLGEQLREQEAAIERRLSALRRISESRDSLEARIAALREQQAALGGELQELAALVAPVLADPTAADTAPVVHDERRAAG